MNKSLRFVADEMVEILIAFYSEKNYLLVTALHSEEPHLKEVESDDKICIDTMDSNGVSDHLNAYYFKNGNYQAGFHIEEGLNFRLGITVWIGDDFVGTRGVDLLPEIGLRLND